MWYNNYWGQIPLDLAMSKKSAKKLAQFQNRTEFCNFFERYFTLAQNQFRWSGLPDTCDERFLERAFILLGRAMIAKVEGAYVTLGAANGADINLYGYPLNAYGWGLNGFNRSFSCYVPGADDSGVLTKAASGRKGYKAPECVIGYDNVDAYPMVTYIITAAQRLSNILRASDVAVESSKTPYVVSCDEANVSTVREALKQREDNVSAIIGIKGSFDLQDLKIWPTQMPPDTLANLWQQYCNVQNELLEVFGIESNPQSDKRERLLVDEVNANNQAVHENLAKRLYQRQLFAERVNDCFGLNISVEVANYNAEEGDEYADDLDGMDGEARDDGPVRGSDN